MRFSDAMRTFAALAWPCPVFKELCIAMLLLGGALHYLMMFASLVQFDNMGTTLRWIDIAAFAAPFYWCGGTSRHERK